MDCHDTETIQLELDHGTITGLAENGLFRARGIRYAQAQRFQPPAPIDPSDGPVDGTKPATVCAQNPSRLSSVTGDIIKGRPMEEDCLHITITAPAHALDQPSKLPTMVFFHGGANVSGGGDLDCYGAQSLASRGLVVVNVTYRLGIFGWIPIRDVAPANLGLLDQIEALRWVQKNISRVGGDPQQVTVVGHSVGAYSIYCMMFADDAADLFQRAILQSTPLGWQHVTSSASDQLARVSRSLLPDNVLALSTEELLTAQQDLVPEAKRLGLHITVAWPHFGKYPLPETSEIPERIRRSATKYRILTGWTQDESVAFVPMMPRHALYSGLPLLGGLYERGAYWWYSHKEFIWPSQQFHKSVSEAGGSSSTYCFRWSPPGNPLKAVHCIELPFLFGSWDSWKEAPMLRGQGVQDVVERVGPEVKDTWAAFASEGAFPTLHFDIDRNFSFQGLQLGPRAKRDLC